MRAFALIALVALVAAAEAVPLKKIALFSVNDPNNAAQVEQVKAAVKASFDKYKAANPSAGVELWLSVKDKALLPPHPNKPPRDPSKPWVRYSLAAIWSFQGTEDVAKYQAWKEANSNKDEWKALPIASKASIVVPA